MNPCRGLYLVFWMSVLAIAAIAPTTTRAGETQGYTVAGAAEENCGSPCWHNGWLAYEAAADEHERDF
jgi:hypothetical protein